jgi:3-hydroxy acid dehydrogenase / malonic semialdehyde reductase
MEKNIMSLLDNFFSVPEVSLKGKLALVTGASSGIGLATTAWLAREKVNLILVARRKEKLELLKKEILELFPTVEVKLIVSDVSSSNFISLLENSKALNVDILINNAGLASGKDYVTEMKDEDLNDMIQTNVTSLIRLTSAVSKKMVQNGSGHIVNLGSIAGHYTYEGGSIYCATKFAVRAFTETLRQELHDKNVRVSLISPGMVKTDFSLVRFKGDSKLADSVYQGVECLTAEDIARLIIKTLKEPVHVNWNEVVILPTVQSPVSYKIKRNNE